MPLKGYRGEVLEALDCSLSADPMIENSFKIVL